MVIWNQTIGCHQSEFFTITLCLVTKDLLVTLYNWQIVVLWKGSYHTVLFCWHEFILFNFVPCNEKWDICHFPLVRLKGGLLFQNNFQNSYQFIYRTLIKQRIFVFFLVVLCTIVLWCSQFNILPCGLPCTSGSAELAMMLWDGVWELQGDLIYLWLQILLSLRMLPVLM